jgi:uncharacterized membrane protein
MRRARRAFFTLLAFISSTLITVQILALPLSVKTVQRLAGVMAVSPPTPVYVARLTDRTLGYLYNFSQDDQKLEAYNSRERTHLREVHRRFWQARVTLAAGLALLTIGVSFGWWREIYFVDFIKTMLIINLALGAAIVFAFSAFFEAFHRLLFAPGSYFFYEDDLLIRLFPPRFWWLMFVSLIGMNLVQLPAVWMARTLTRRQRFNRVSVRKGVKDGKC